MIVNRGTSSGRQLHISLILNDPYQYDEPLYCIEEGSYEDYNSCVDPIDDMDVEDDPWFYDMDYLQLGCAANECGCTCCCDTVECCGNGADIKLELIDSNQLFPLEMEDTNPAEDAFSTHDVVKAIKRVCKIMARPIVDYHQLVWVEQDLNLFCDRINMSDLKQMDLMLGGWESAKCLFGNWGMSRFSTMATCQWKISLNGSSIVNSLTRRNVYEPWDGGGI